jgi:predicted membrane protein DUF2157
MDSSLFEKLHTEGNLTDASLQRVRAHASSGLFSVHWELKTLLYCGVLLLTTGLGVLVYKNIDIISHQVLLMLIALVCASSFFYCFQTKAPFSTGKVSSPHAFFDYILLLGCLTFLMLTGYLQAQYNLFGNRYGLMTFIPLVVLFSSAYYFDHLGILSLAITNLAAWVGITVTPSKILADNDFNSSTLIISGLLLGSLLLVVAILTKRYSIKPHFAFTYTNFGAHLAFISCLAGLFHFESVYFLWFLLLLGLAWVFYQKSLQERSFYYLLILTLYTYIGLSYVIVRFLLKDNFSSDVLYLVFMYFISSAIGIILFLIKMNKKLKHHDSI